MSYTGRKKHTSALLQAMYQQQQGELESTVQDQAAKLAESKRALASVESRHERR